MAGLLGCLSWCLGAIGAEAPALPVIIDVPAQPLVAQARRLIEAAQFTGEPFSPAEIAALEAAFRTTDDAEAVTGIQRVLDPRCLVGVQINPESRVKLAPGPARAELVERGWRQFLVKVHNEAGVTAELRVESPNAGPVYRREWERQPLGAGRDLWLDVAMFNAQPLRPRLSGLAVEYRILQLYSRDRGQREAHLAFNVGQGTQDLGFRNELDVLFDCRPANAVTFRVRDEHGKPAMATFTIRDAQGRVYPAMSKRLAPDFGFHPQIYRADGETERLPAGEYDVEYGRGPEYHRKQAKRRVDGPAVEWTFALERWIDPAQQGWWSGDHHIHAAGCAHYARPTEGVHAPDMMRHCLGEDLKVGANLTWGPCFDYQKQFFTGQDDKVSQPPYLLHYDVEVSGFGSHESGHLCLLRLKEQIYPGGESKHHWPTLGLNTLRWAKKQGAVCGPAHSGWGLEVKTAELPNYETPPFDGIGANEYIVDVTHQVPGPDGALVPAVDFLSLVDTPYVWELNIWYHTLNVGYRTRGSGETDFPCIYGERVGLGRSYVKLDGDLTYDDWCEGIRRGRSYVGDGKSHLLNFRINDVALGEKGSELELAAPGSVRLRVDVAALLDATSRVAASAQPYADKRVVPYWDLERARIGSSRSVPVEVILNGFPVARREIEADGGLRELTFDLPIERSSWVAVRILPSSHTNPIWVLVGDKPVRASRRSAAWCLASVDQCWKQKQRAIKPAEMAEAEAAYEHARARYRAILAESAVD